MQDRFIYQTFTDTGGDYHRLVVSDGDSMVEVRLDRSPNAVIQTDTLVVKEDVDAEEAIGSVKEFLEEEFVDSGVVSIN